MPTRQEYSRYLMKCGLVFGQTPIEIPPLSGVRVKARRSGLNVRVSVKV